MNPLNTPLLTDEYPVFPGDCLVDQRNAGRTTTSKQDCCTEQQSSIVCPLSLDQTRENMDLKGLFTDLTLGV